MKKRDLAIGIVGAALAAIAVKILTRPKSVVWENISDQVEHSENSHFVNVDGAKVHYQEKQSTISCFLPQKPKAKNRR